MAPMKNDLSFHNLSVEDANGEATLKVIGSKQSFVCTEMMQTEQ